MVYEKFKDFVIEDPCYLGEEPESAKYTYALTRTGKRGRFVVANLVWNLHEPCFEFEGIGMRYQENNVPGLDEWLLRWTEMKAFEHNNSEEYIK